MVLPKLKELQKTNKKNQWYNGSNMEFEVLTELCSQWKEPLKSPFVSIKKGLEYILL